MMITPHSGITAYVAVSFQAFFGAIIYSFFKINLVSVLIVTTIGLVESAIQKILVMTVLFGKSLWDSINALGTSLEEKYAFILPFDSSALVIFSYVTIYFLTGILVGINIYRLIKELNNTTNLESYKLNFTKSDSSNSKGRKSKWRRWILLTVILITTLGLIIFFESQSSSFDKAIYILARTIIILLFWYILISPILIILVKKYLFKKQKEWSNEVESIFNIIPYLRSIVKEAWKLSQSQLGLSRIRKFLFLTIMFSLHGQFSEA